MIRHALTLMLCMMLSASAQAASFAELPADQRIRLLRYDAGEVYSIATRVGYQTNIEFSTREEIETISVGDRSFWQIIPSGNRLFIRPLNEGVSTNMTVITNRRAYQFDLVSVEKATSKIVYVVRFLYPEDEMPRPAPFDTAPAMVPAPMPVPTTATPPAVKPMAFVNTDTAALPPAPAPQIMHTSSAPRLVEPGQNERNYLYTFSGSAMDAPHTVFDDGRTIYFRYAAEDESVTPRATVFNAAGKEVVVPVERRGAYYAIAQLAPVVVLRHYPSSPPVYLYNEMMSPR